MSLFQTPAQITKISTMVDGGLKVEVVTQEVGAEEKTALFNLHKAIGWFLFKDKKVEEADLVNLPEFKKEFKGDKTPGERLRAVLYVWWEQNGSQGKFDDFYRNKMEDIIDKIKEKLV